MDQMLCKELYFSPSEYFVQQSRTGWIHLLRFVCFCVVVAFYGRRPYEEHSYKKLNLNQWFKRCCCFMIF